jgi:hypothetical protein
MATPPTFRHTQTKTANVCDRLRVVHSHSVSTISHLWLIAHPDIHNPSDSPTTPAPSFATSTATPQAGKSDTIANKSIPSRLDFLLHPKNSDSSWVRQKFHLYLLPSGTLKYLLISAKTFSNPESWQTTSLPVRSVTRSLSKFPPFPALSETRQIGFPGTVSSIVVVVLEQKG